MVEKNSVWLADLSNTGNESSALRIKAVMSFLGEIDPPTSLVARALLGLCGSPGGRRIAGDPLLEDTTITLDDLLTLESVRAQCLAGHEAGSFIRREVDRLRRMRVDWCRDVASLPYGDGKISPYSGDELLDIVEVTEWTSTSTGSARTILSWKVRGGQWAYWSMNPLGRALLCRLAGASLMLPDQAAIDLATNLLIVLVLSARPDDPLKPSSYEIGWLLHQAGMLARPECRTMAWESDMRHRFETVMQASLEAGIFSGLTLPAGWRSEVNGAVAGEWLHDHVSVIIACRNQDAGSGAATRWHFPGDHGMCWEI